MPQSRVSIYLIKGGSPFVDSTQTSRLPFWEMGLNLRCNFSTSRSQTVGATQEQIAKIQDILQQMDEHLQKPASENRRAPRLNVRAAMTVMLLSSAGPTPVQVFSRNLSVSGIAFVSRRMFAKEERVAVMLKIPKLPAKLILSRITFGRYVNNGLYEMGAEFLECISDPRGQGTIPKQWLLTAVLQPKAPPAPLPPASPGPPTPPAAAAKAEPAAPAGSPAVGVGVAEPSAAPA